MYWFRRSALVLAVTAAASACGHATSPLEPTPVMPAAPVVTNAALPQASPVTLQSQTVRLSGNILTMTWPATGAQPGDGWRLEIGSLAAHGDAVTTSVTSSSRFEWSNARPGTYTARVAVLRDGAVGPFSADTLLTVVDLRDVIDAMLFWSGPYSDTGSVSNTRMAAWPDGTNVTLLTSTDVTPVASAAAVGFANTYSLLWGSTVSATVVAAADAMGDWDYDRVPTWAVAIRVKSGACPSGAAGCNTGGPPQIVGQTGKSILTISSPNLSVLVGHELGHAFGLGHLKFPVSAATYGLANPMMAPTTNTMLPTDCEAEALRVVRASGLRAGATRSQAAAAGLVRP